MSKEHVDRFLETLSRNDGLREKLGVGRLTEKKVTSLASRLGFEFNVAELRSAAAPLTDDEWGYAARKFGDDCLENYIVFLEEVPMSKEALSAFFKKVADDEGLQKKLVEFAAEQGFAFSADELNDSDLDGVAGGLFTSLVDYRVDSVKPVPANTVDHNIADQTTLKVEPKSIDVAEIKFDGLDK